MQNVIGLARTLRADIEGNFAVKITEGSVLVPWIIRHAGWALSRFSQDASGRTPYQKLHGRPYQGDVYNMCETVMGKECTSMRKAKLEDIFVHGAWRGRTTKG